MAQSVTVTPIIGLPTYSGWAQVVVARTLTNITSVIAVSIEGDGAARVGENLTAVIEAEPPRSPEALYHLFEETVVQVAEYGCSCSLAGGVFRQGRSILAAYNGEILLKREKKMAPVLAAETQIQLIQGRSQLDDAYVFATASARQFLSTVALTYEKGYDTDSVVMAMVPQIHTLEDSSLAALGFAQLLDEGEGTQAAGDERNLASVPLVDDETSMPISFEESESRESIDTSKNIGSQESASQVEQTQEYVEHSTPSESPGFDQTRIQPVRDSAAQPIGKMLLTLALPFWRKLPTIGSSIGSVLQKLARIFLAILAASIDFSKKMISPGDYVEYERLRKVRIVVGMSVVAVLIGLAAWWVVSWQRARQETIAAEAIAPYQSRLELIREMADEDILQARDEVQLVLRELVTMQVSAEDSNDAALANAVGLLLLDVEALATSISGREELSELPIAVDLRSIRSNFLASDMVMIEETLLVVDRVERQALLINLVTNQTTEIDLTEVGEIRSLSLKDSLTALFLGEGVYQLALNPQVDLSESIAQGDSNREGTLLGSYGSFVYVLNPVRRNIYRYSQTSDGYSAPIGWLTGPLGISFEELTSWAIDGDIWIGTQDGRIRKYTTGRQADFELQGLEQPFSGSVYIQTSSELSNLYVLEPSKNRLVVLTKDGQFLRQITHVSLATATSFSVSEVSQIAYVVSGSLIFSLPLVY